MKIFSFFDTNLTKKKYNEYVEKYGKDHVVLVKRSKLFKRLFVIIPTVIYIIAAALLIYALYTIARRDGVIYVGLPVIIGGFIAVMISVFKKLIDYYMDFTIITVEEIIAYNQHGIFKRKVQTLGVDSVKTITTNIPNIFQSIFNNGSVVFLSEGDMVRGEITLTYIYDPERIKGEIQRIVEDNF